ncbi:MAG: DUF4965 domain-containing protein [bacterium]
MQLMCDALAVLGSRHGLLWDTPGKKCGIMRFDRFSRLVECHLRAGVVIEGVEYLFSLCPEGGNLAFQDQRMTPCTMALIGFHAESNIRVKLMMVTPFRPRDAEFSTTPVIGLRLEVEQVDGIFRWESKTVKPEEVEIFLEIAGPQITAAEYGDDCIDLAFDSVRGATYVGMKDAWDAVNTTLLQHDRLLLRAGTRRGTRVVQTVKLPAGGALEVDWLTWSASVMEVSGVSYPFRYAGKFADLDAVTEWARAHGAELWSNAARVDGIIGANNCGNAINHLLAQTLHSWLVNTWWGANAERERYFVWEGSCLMTSTVDVEYTQSPFYLAVWPELLGLELDMWPEFSADGATTLGERGAGTLYLAHDSGAHATANGVVYSHPMEVEENTNYVIMAYAYFARTGNDRLLHKHAATIEKYLAFLIAADSTSDGIPDLGVANTIDDASPAIQFGREQVYLAVKTMAAFIAGAEILAYLGKEKLAESYQQRAELIREAVETRGWQVDHFATLVEKSGKLVNPWSKVEMDCAEIPGWDAPHIYTANGLALLDMVGLSTNLSEEMLICDLQVATARCLREYGCVHSDFENGNTEELQVMMGLAGVARCPGWVSMNMLRDQVALRRGLDLRALSERYWEWQVTTNTQEPKLFFETFNGNNLCFYPRGIAIWGIFEALAGVVINIPNGVNEELPALPQVLVPTLFDAAW